MEKIVSISGKDVRLKSSAALPLRYKAQFGRDLFADITKMQDTAEGDMSMLDTEVFYNIIWAMAKCANPNLPPLLDWVDSFDEFPVFEIFNEADEIFRKSIGTTIKNPIAVEVMK